MGKAKLYDVKVNISMPSEMTDWLDSLVKTGKFGSRSHGIRRCVRIAKDDPEVAKKL